ncbi:MAG: prolyl oligopeptidase family serine peptidase [Pseudomonadota bacterium]
MRRIRLFCSALSLALAGTAAAGSLTSQEIASLRSLSDPVLPPDETRLVVTVGRQDDADVNQRLWQLPLGGEGDATFALTAATSNAWAGQFVGDGQWLYFLSDRSGRHQVWRLHAQGGDAEAVTDLALDIEAFQVAPDAKAIVVLVNTVRACGADFGCTQDAIADSYDIAAKVWSDERTPAVTQGRLFVVSLTDGIANNDEWVELTAPIDGGVGNTNTSLPSSLFAISPDSRRVAFSASAEKQQPGRLTNTDLFEVRLSGGRVRNLTAENEGPDTGPRYLPNGELVWLSAKQAFGSYRHWVIQHRRSNGATRVATPAWDRSPADIIVTNDPNKVYAIAVDEGRRRLFEVELDNGIVFPRSAFGWVQAAIDAKSGPIVIMDSLHQPVELHQIAALDSALYRLSAFNVPTMADVTAGVYEVFRTGSDNGSLSAFLLRPPGHDGERKVPLVVLLRSTQHGTLGDHFRHDWVPQQLAAAGVAVLMIDYRGADGYGPTFATGFAADAATALDDIDIALRTAVERYSWLDNTKVCAAGAGLGGTLAQTIAARSPEQFRCLVSVDPIYDTRTAALYRSVQATTDPSGWIEPGRADVLDPATLANRLVTPTLVIHQDKYATFQQAAALYGDLQRREVDTVLMQVTPNTDGELSFAAQARLASAVNNWLERFLDL